MINKFINFVKTLIKLLMDENFFLKVLTDLVNNIKTDSGNNGKLSESERNQLNKLLDDMMFNLENDYSKSKLLNIIAPDVLGGIHDKVEKWIEEGVTDEVIIENIREELGEPDDSRIVELDIGVVEQQTWIIGTGTMVLNKNLTPEEVTIAEIKNKITEPINPFELMMSKADSSDVQFSNPFEHNKVKKPSLTLEERLKIAIDNEEYEEAAKIHDKMKANDIK